MSPAMQRIAVLSWVIVLVGNIGLDRRSQYILLFLLLRRRNNGNMLWYASYIFLRLSWWGLPWEARLSSHVLTEPEEWWPQRYSVPERKVKPSDGGLACRVLAGDNRPQFFSDGQSSDDPLGLLHDPSSQSLRNVVVKEG